MRHVIPPDLKPVSLINIILKYNCQSLNLKNKRSCVVNGIYISITMGNLNIKYIKERLHVEKYVLRFFSLNSLK